MSNLFSLWFLFSKFNIFFLILNVFPKPKPLAFGLLETIKSIDIGDRFVLENLISDLKLLPVPEMKTAVLTYL